MPDLVDVHIDSTLPNFSVDPNGQGSRSGHGPPMGKSKTASDAGVKHTHAVAGGGQLTHTHPLTDAKQHSHGANTDDNGSDKQLLPFQNTTVAAAEPSAGRAGDFPAGTKFAYTDSKGGKHLPIHDAAHVRNAISRFNQTNFESDDDKKKAAAAIRSAAKQFGVEVGDDSKVAASEADDVRWIELAEPAVMLQLSERPQLINIEFSDPVRLDEHEFPYIVEGHWDFGPDSDIGPLDVTPDHLDVIQRHFRENARGQDLPVCDIDHMDPAFRGAAVGWVKDLERRQFTHPKTGEPMEGLAAIVDLNDVGEKLRREDQFRYVSPSLLRNWRDPESGEVYPFIAAGVDVRTRGTAVVNGKEVSTDTAALALTNRPRLKKLGRIAASENGTEAVVLHIGKPGGLRDPSPARQAALLMADDPDMDGDDDGPTPPCCYQPSVGGTCPGYTRWPGDDDGDGVCLMSQRGCNGYIAITSGNAGTPSMYGFKEPPGGTRVSKEEQQTVQGAEGGSSPPPESTPPVAAPSATTEPAATEPSADAAEDQNIRAAERRATDGRIEAAEREAREAKTAAEAATAELARMRMAERQADVVSRANACLRTGRMTKADHARFTEPDAIVLLSENEQARDLLLGTFEARPPFSIAGPQAFNEVGSSEAPNLEQQDSVRLAERTREIHKDVYGGRPADYVKAARQAAREAAQPGGIPAPASGGK